MFVFHCQGPKVKQQGKPLRDWAWFRVSIGILHGLLAWSNLTGHIYRPKCASWSIRKVMNQVVLLIFS